MFRILVVDDDPASAHLLREVIGNLERRNELHFVWSGAEALDFLHGRGAHREAPRPNLILLDMNMPGLSGLDVLSVLKGDPDLRVIPVIMLSASDSPDDVRKSYQTHANCYVQKPIDLDRSVKLIQAVEAFWMDFALFPDFGDSVGSKRRAADSKALESHRPHHAKSGSSAVVSRAAHAAESSGQRIVAPSRRLGCEEHTRLLDEFGATVRELLKLHEQQFVATVEGDSDCSRFDLLIHMGNEKKQVAKYAYLRHVEEHGCSSFDGLPSS